MSIRPCTAIRPRPDGQYRPQDQDAPAGGLLQLPPNVIGRIGNFVATGNTPQEAAANGVRWSRVCVYTHVSSHESGVAQRVQQALEDDALLKMWGPLSGQLNFHGNPPPQTLAEIKAWFDDPANADRLNQIANLNLSNLGIKTIPPQITKCTQLRELDLYNNNITDVSPLKNLGQLQKLDLAQNKITDVSALQNLLQLQTLELSSNQIRDISALANLAELRELNLIQNQIIDVSALGNCTQLRCLKLSNNQITDVSALGNLVELRVLNLAQNQITDISALRNLTQLQQLFLNDNQIADVSALENLSQLQQLWLNHNQIADVSALGNLSHLNCLDLNDNRISDVSALGNLSQLSDLRLSINQITDTSALGKLSQLVMLQINKNLITDVSGLAKLKAFITIDRNSIFFMCIDKQNNTRHFNPNILDKQEEFKTYKCKSALSNFIQFMAQKNVGLEEIQQRFSELDPQDRNLIYAMVYQVSGSESTDPQWGEHHVFDSKAVFYRAVREAISAKFEGLSQNEKKMVYEQIYELAGRPETRDPIVWGKNNAFENLLRLVDAMNRVANVK
ncbi:MAG: leucine-rich repeat domain-containing protein [Verrucomicrobia bacterium]|nr:leucine-rich repeat domain-containing protein [Verrucomicrobiota bacterium]